MIKTPDDPMIHKKTSKGRRGGHLPVTFVSLSEARDCFIYYWLECTNPREPIDLKSPEEITTIKAEWREQTLAIYDQYNASFRSFLALQGPKLNKSEWKGVKVLQIHHCVAFMSVNIGKAMMDDETVWDPHVPVFEKMVSLADEVVLLECSEQAPPVFSIDMGIIGPLYEVASKCRDPTIRRRAINIMKDAPRQEGIWNSSLVARVAERVVEIEEEGLGAVNCCADVPDWARLSDVDPSFAMEHRKAILSYSRRKSANEFVRSTFVEEIVW
jgi:hypothetical protein